MVLESNIPTHVSTFVNYFYLHSTSNSLASIVGIIFRPFFFNSKITSVFSWIIWPICSFLVKSIKFWLKNTWNFKPQVYLNKSSLYQVGVSKYEQKKNKQHDIYGWIFFFVSIRNNNEFLHTNRLFFYWCKVPTPQKKYTQTHSHMVWNYFLHVHIYQKYLSYLKIYLI